ncbi:helix-turn-helix domain-containing protein [Megamonas hypermegale]|uniref:helix-turn-helix domain-containing protein n=1 Tax=Megamonas hypermegale TaxID=158847 RepID=UPI0026ED03EE|nr:helix-turn-helix transcriptional regulator [Megamonas hypermegale]
MGFQENLKYYREKAGYKTAKDFSEALSLPYATYAAYENKNREPKYNTLCKIADLLNVSTDELLGAKEKTYTAKDLDRLAIRNRIMLEVEKQERQWGNEKDLNPFQMLSLIAEEFGEVSQAVNETYLPEKARDKNKHIKNGKYAIENEVYQTIALLFRFIENLPEVEQSNEK